LSTPDPESNVLDALVIGAGFAIYHFVAGTVWATSCNSWYKREDGHITVLYPFNAQTFRRRHKNIFKSHFEIRDRAWLST
jgi:hypothetical protein